MKYAEITVSPTLKESPSVLAHLMEHEIMPRISRGEAVVIMMHEDPVNAPSFTQDLENYNRMGNGR
jgi:hypothetical protein